VSHYPGALWLPWTYWSPDGQPTYYKGTNRPAAVVIHRMQGHWQTAVQWAAEGHYGASWTYTVAFDGRVAQHLEHEDGGYHAGIVQRPSWALLQPGANPNNYTIGIECEGFVGDEWPEAQLHALRDLCRWLAVELDIRLDYDHFPPHAAIDSIDRPNDFDFPPRRDTIVYPFLFSEEDDMSQADIELLHNLARRVLAGSEEGAMVDAAQALELARYRAGQWASTRSVADIAASTQAMLAGHASPANHPGVGASVPDHTHEPGGVKR